VARRAGAAWLAVTSALRLGWTLAGANRYERSNLSGDGAVHYLLPSTAAQGLLQATAALLGLLATLVLLRRRAKGDGPAAAPMPGLVPAALAAPPEVSLLLPNDGCDVLAATGEARLQSWIIRPWSQLDARFGPLRRLPGWD
jgi:hypothetical protein